MTHGNDVRHRSFNIHSLIPSTYRTTPIPHKHAPNGYYRDFEIARNAFPFQD